MTSDINDVLFPMPTYRDVPTETLRQFLTKAVDQCTDWQNMAMFLERTNEVQMRVYAQMTADYIGEFVRFVQTELERRGG